MRTVLYHAVLAVCVLTACLSTGCRLCCAPYDYCGPVFQCGGCSDLSTRRCGSGVYGPACGPCGAKNVAVMQQPQNPAQISPMNGQPVMPTQSPAVHGSHVQYIQPGQQVPMVMMQAPQQPQIMNTAQVMPTPKMAVIQPQIGTQVAARALPRTQVMTATAAQGQLPPGTTIVPQQGVIEVQVFDEKGNFLGTEKMDANGNTLNHVPHPGSAGMATMPQRQVMMVPQQQVMVAQPQNYVPVSMNGGGWKTRTQPR